MATTAGSIPLSFHASDDKTPIGVELDIAQLVADKLGLELDVQVTSWENWPLKTQSGDFEAVFSNVGINAARVKLFDFSSYRAAYMGFEAKKSSSYDIKGSDDISGLKISVGSGTNQEKILIAWNKELEAKGKAPAVLQYYSSDADTILALSSGRTDLNIAPFPSVTYRENTRDDLKVVGKVNAGWPSETLVAATTLKGNGLAPAITDALNSAIKDGSYGKVLERWGLSEEALAGVQDRHRGELRDRQMKFQVLDIIPHLKNPVTGEIVSTADRLNQVVRTAQRAEELGYDSFSVGERHAGEFISSSPTTVLAAIAAVTTTIRLQSGVTVLSVLDPVRVAEDYATIDQLSRGRLELVIGKGNEVLQYPLFGLDLDDQWELLAEKYGLLRRLWTEENVTWSGRFRPALTEPTTTTPRPFAGAPRVWHGSATSLTSAALAAKWGDPLFTANAIQPRENYAVLIEHYREEYERHGHDPKHQYLGSGAGAGGVFIADTTQEAKRQFGPVYEALTAGRNVPGNNSPYRDIDHAVAEGPALVGSPEQVIDKILSYHELYGHDLQSISLPTTQPFEQQLDILERFALEVVPAVRAAAPTTLWGRRRSVRRPPGRPASPAKQAHRTRRRSPRRRRPHQPQELPCLRPLKPPLHRVPQKPSPRTGPRGTPRTNATAPTRTASSPSPTCTGSTPRPRAWTARPAPGAWRTTSSAWFCGPANASSATGRN